jgi:hypothetical protein
MDLDEMKDRAKGISCMTEDRHKLYGLILQHKSVESLENCLKIKIMAHGMQL